jgi:predicted regulator of Ras-like GTPase activity (Roadblock/LC7/MglB family)
MCSSRAGCGEGAPNLLGRRRPQDHGSSIASSSPERIVSEVMFREALQSVVDNTDGGIAGLLMDFEGIPLESYAREDSPFDIEAVGAEVSVVVKAIQRATEMLEAGDTREVAFKSAKMITLIRVLNDNYFVALTLKPEGNMGKGRFLLRVAAPTLIEELS